MKYENRLNKPDDEKYPIEKGVKMPPLRGSNLKKTGFIFKNCPSKEMEVGDSFAVHIPNDDDVNYVQAIIKTRVRTYGFRCKPPKAFITKFNPYKMELRVWRTV